jgi:MATE family multidrug resistance protein
MNHHWLTDARRIATQAWPILVGQLAVLAFSTIDTVLVARHSPADLAAFAVGTATYVTVFVTLMGVLQALSPIVGRLFGAGLRREAGSQLHQGLWLVLGLVLAGDVVLLCPGPFLSLAQAPPETEAKVRAYLAAQALSLPAALLFTVYRAFNTAVSRPKAVMVLQLGSLMLKMPLTALLVSGWPSLGWPAMGVQGCGVATAVALWAEVLVAAWLLWRDDFYTPFALWSRPWPRPDRAALSALLRLGLPIAGSFLIEVSAFSFMALFIARLGTEPVAAHQIAMNLISLMYMLPFSLAQATSTLVAQGLGAQEPALAKRLGWHGLQLALLLALILGSSIYLARHAVLSFYTPDIGVVHAALPLLTWLALFHVADAVQTMVAFILRAWHIATGPMLIHATALWGVGLAGGYALAFNWGGDVPLGWRGAPGFWTAATAGLIVASGALTALMLWVLRQAPTLSRPAVPNAVPPAT